MIHRLLLHNAAIIQASDHRGPTLKVDLIPSCLSYPEERAPEQTATSPESAGTGILYNKCKYSSTLAIIANDQTPKGPTFPPPLVPAPANF